MVQGSFPSCGAVPCYKGWRDCWDLIQILLKSKQGSLHESMCIHAGLGGGEAFLSTSNCRKKFCLDENKPGRNSSVDLSLKISGCNNKRCLWTKLGALPTLQETDGCTASPLSGRLPASPVTQFPHHGKLWGQASTKGTAWGLLEDINAAHCGEYYYLHLDLIAQCVYTIVHMHMWLPWWQLYSDMKWP